MPQAVLAGPTGSILTGSAPPAPLSCLQRQQRAGAALAGRRRSHSPPGSASFYHPSPSRLQSCLAPRREWHGAGVPHRPPAPLHTKAELSVWVL